MVAAPPNGAGMDATAASEAILKRFAQSENNLEFLEMLTAEQEFPPESLVQPNQDPQSSDMGFMYLGSAP